MQLEDKLTNDIFPPLDLIVYAKKVKEVKPEEAQDELPQVKCEVHKLKNTFRADGTRRSQASISDSTW